MFARRIRHVLNQPLLLWLLLWVVVALLYLPAWKAGFQQDFHGWLTEYNDETFWQILNRKSAGIISFYQFTQLQLYCWTALFGTHPLPWFLLFTGLHALNGVLLFRLCRAVLTDFGLAAAAEIAFAGALLTLFNPSMTEVVVWKASYHYLVGVQAILWMLLWARDFVFRGTAAIVWRSAILFLLLAFTLEIWYTIPVMTAMLLLCYRRAGIIEQGASRKAFRLIVLPQLCILAAHLVVYRILYGSWLAHSAYATGNDGSILFTTARFWTYEWHLLGFGRFFPHEFRQRFYDRSDGAWAGLAALAFVAVLIEWAWKSYPRWNASARAAGLLAGWSLVGLVIVLHFTPPDLFHVSNDRYLYLTAFFQWTFIVLLVYRLFETRFVWRRAAVAALLLVCLFLTAKLVLEWRRAAKVFWAIQDKFVWKDAPVVLILNMPSLYKGIGIIRGSDTSEIGEHMRVFGKGAPRGTICDISSYNMEEAGDGAHVLVQDSNHLRVTLNQWGTWWMMRGFGAQDRSNALFDLHLDDPGHFYTLTLKQLPPGMVILFHQGLEWRVVDMSKIGREQWK